MSELIDKALENATDTQAIVTGRGVVNQTGEVFKKVFGDARAILVADENTWAVAGEQVKASLEAAGVELEEPHIFPGTPTLYAGYENVTIVREVLEKVDAVAVSIAGGTLNDITKLASGELGRLYMNVCTAASMDGYAAFGASITRDGFKITRNCPAPTALVADYEIMAAAPARLTATGLGDLIEKVPGGADWLVADELGVEALDDYVWDLVQGPLREALSNPDGLAAGDPDAIVGLADELLLSGLAMQAHQSSRPASGAGHNFSHQWEMEGHGLDWEPPLSHGQKVGIGTIASSAVYDILDQLDVAGVDPEKRAAEWLTPEQNDQRIIDLQPIPAIQEAALGQSRAKYIPAEQVAERVQLIKDHWDTILTRVKPQVMSAPEIADILKRVGGPYHVSQIDISLEKLKLTYYQSQTIRSRYTIMDALFELGLLDEVVEKLFGPDGYWTNAPVPTEGNIYPTA
ncbi:sn-glycerol-1-phosphate dehydrogenase [Aestuariimicrobium sp. Y1814]|uniref:sn-glycerol-1-phosphate dehydrogenase n=1 Tax=Aestuariimicrobium sp. Y1814 TaxID=3418742 RepID=UPI003DA7440D